MKRAIPTLLAAVVLAGGAIGCGDDDEAESPAAAGGGDGGSEFAGKKLCLNKYADAEPVAQADTGIRAGLEELGAGDIEIEEKNANGDVATQQTIAQQFASGDCDIITPFGGAPTQSYLKLDSKAPVVFTNAGSPIEIGAVKSYEAPGGNFTGAATPIPVADEIDTMRKIIPDMKTVGLIYAGGDPQGEANAKASREHLESLGLKYVNGPLSGSGDTAAVTQSLVGKKVDAIQMPCDNPTLTGQAGIMKVANEAKTPVFGCTGTAVENGAILAGGYDYEQVGRLTADVIVDVLKGADPATTPVVVPEIEGFFVNETAAKKFGLTIPEDVLANSPGTF